MSLLRPLILILMTLWAAPALAETKPIRVILVGDSTMTDKSGYGKGFCAQFTPEVTCLNVARGGRSSKSYRVEGLWDNVLKTLSEKDGFAQTYVLIAFGHNDASSRPERHTDIETEFPVNMRQLARDVKAAGAVPILVTPLTQRHFRDFRLQADLLPWANATRVVARSEGIALIDLYAVSQKAVQDMGIAESFTLAGQPVPDNVHVAVTTGTTVPAKFTDASQGQGSQQAFDYGHVGPKGSDYFGKMVVDLWLKADPKIAPYVKP